MNTIKIEKEKINKAVNTVKMLSADAVQKANSGHPGMPMGCADLAFLLWMNFLRFNPENPKWPNRDRFILSGGHGSALIYSLLHLFGFPLSIDDLKEFRQLNSITPGHPEYRETAGVETSTGPLGQGFANGVGMALAERLMATRLNVKNDSFIDHHTYVIATDGDLMEGISSEAASLAGHLGLSRLICLYDSNNITIEGDTDLAFTEDVGLRFKGYNWHVLHVNGYDHQEIIEAIEKGKQENEKPTLIIVRTRIGKGSPKKEGTASAHGEPLGVDEIKILKDMIGWPEDPFFVPEETKKICNERVRELKEEYDKWKDLYSKNVECDPEMNSLWMEYYSGNVPDNLEEELLKTIKKDSIATRSASGDMMQVIASKMSSFIGGSADLSPSTKTNLKNYSDIEKGKFEGRNMHFGIREHAMGSIINGMSLYGGIIPYGSTFLVFSDYMRPSLRLAALMRIQAISVFTHDSIFVGEDGPTHQPVEQVASLRLIPGLRTIRPADATETAAAWVSALKYKDGPTALILSRQNLPVLENDVSKFDQKKFGLHNGAYILKDFSEGTPEYILMASGSEVSLAVKAAEMMNEKGALVRVVSIPCFEIFETQNDDYKEMVLPAACKKRVAVEAGASMSWYKYVGNDGIIIGIDRFGKSAPAAKLAEYYGFTPEKVFKKMDDKWKL